MGKSRWAMCGLLALCAASCGGSASPGSGSTDVPTSTTEPVSMVMERRVTEFVTAYLEHAFTQRPALNGRVPKEEFTGCVSAMSLGAARSVFSSRELPQDSSPKRPGAELAAASEALSAAQSSIESAIASCSRG